MINDTVFYFLLFSVGLSIIAEIIWFSIKFFNTPLCNFVIKHNSIVTKDEKDYSLRIIK